MEMYVVNVILALHVPTFVLVEGTQKLLVQYMNLHVRHAILGHFVPENHILKTVQKEGTESSLVDINLYQNVKFVKKDIIVLALPLVYHVHQANLVLARECTMTLHVKTVHWDRIVLVQIV